MISDKSDESIACAQAGTMTDTRACTLYVPCSSRYCDMICFNVIKCTAGLHVYIAMTVRLQWCTIL